MDKLTIRIENNAYTINIPNEDINKIIDFLHLHHFSLDHNNSLADLVNISFHASYAKDLQKLFNPLKNNNLDHIILICIRSLTTIVKQQNDIIQCIDAIDYCINDKLQ